MTDSTRTGRRFIFAIVGCLATAVCLPVTAADVKVDGKFVSTADSGPPLEVMSNERVPNLNADRLDGLEGSEVATKFQLAMPNEADVHWTNIVGSPELHINQDCVASGCFPGDDPGFPVEITVSGSYRLTGHLDYSGETTPEDVTGIDVTAPTVSLNLGGFSIIGPASCIGTPVTSCAPQGEGDGISISFTTLSIRIFNGTVRGAADNGINCLTDCLIDFVAVVGNAGKGVDADRVTHLASISRSQAIRNGEEGFSVKGVVRDSTMNGNFLGVRLNGTAGMVINSIASDNLHGISAHTGTVRGNTIFNNTNFGLFCNGCLAESNNIFDNGGGISFQSSLGAPVFGGNRLNGNTTTISSDSEVEISTNICDGITTCTGS